MSSARVAVWPGEWAGSPVLVGLKTMKMAKSMINKCGEPDPGGRTGRQDPVSCERTPEVACRL